MSLADVIIVLVVVVIVGVIIYNIYKKRNESYCSSCSYKKSPETSELFKK